MLLPPGLRSFSVVCERCLEQASPRHGHFGSIVEGAIAEGLRHATIRCTRGHVIAVLERAGGAALESLDSGAGAAA
ncbi:MAG: hypothetical protein ACXVY3_02695 [Gaiellaceae bacterium]